MRNLDTTLLLFWKTVLVVFLGFGTAMSSGQAAERGEPQVDLKRILADWQGRQASLASVRYEVTGKGIVPKGRYTGSSYLPASVRGETLPPEDYVYEKKLTWVVDFIGNRLRKDFKEEEFNGDVGRFVPSRAIYIYDGAMTKRYFPKEENQIDGQPPDFRIPELGLVKNGNTITYTPADYPIFLAQGIVGLVEVMSLVPGPEKVLLPLENLDIKVLGSRFLQGKECLALRVRRGKRTPYVDELWVDASHRSAIVRIDLYADEDLTARVDIDYGEGGDLPTRWTFTQFKGDRGEISFSEWFRVDRVERNPELDPADFDVSLRPGMVVRTADVNGDVSSNHTARDYRVASDGKTLVALDDDAPRGWPWVTVIAVLVIGIAGFAVVARWLRRKRQGRIRGQGSLT
jgi:hypothetical protein